MTRLSEHYAKTVAPELATKFALKNRMAIPKLQKIVINMGVGRATQDKTLLDSAADSLGKISGQKPAITKAKVSVAGFRLREGNEIGCKVTLRGARMFEFLNRLISIALPRIRDFRGVNPNSFDGRGNYTLGLAEHVVFPEIDADRIQHTHGMDITIVTRRRATNKPANCSAASACRSVSRRSRRRDLIRADPPGIGFAPPPR